MAQIFPEIQGAIDDYDLLVIGHLSFNRYFGETADNRPRGQPYTCCATLIQGRQADGTPYRLVVDPTQRLKAEDFYFDLNRRTGLHPQDITHVFITHNHGDHVVGANYFPNARWLSAAVTIEALKDSPDIDAARIQPVAGEFLPGVAMVPLFGHTLHLHGVAFRFQGRKIIVAADAIMTKQHFANETAEFEADTALASQTIRNIKESFDIAIPGHDNLILIR